MPHKKLSIFEGYLNLSVSLFFLMFLLIASITGYAQQSYKNIWKDVLESTIPKVDKRYINPSESRTISFNMNSLEDFLNNAPTETEVLTNGVIPLEISLPAPDGKTEK